MSQVHAERRDPETPGTPVDLASAGAELLAQARAMSSGRAARTLTPGPHAALKQTLVALRAGEELSEHDTNGPATILLLEGSASITAGDHDIDMTRGQWAVIPDVRHGLRARADTVALITVALAGS